MADRPAEAPAHLIPPEGVLIEFPETTINTAGQHCEALKADIERALLDEDLEDDATIRRLRTSDETLDLGTVLAIVLGAKATIAVAIGIQKYLNRPNQVRVRVRHPDGRAYDLTNLESRDTAAVLRALESSG